MWQKINIIIFVILLAGGTLLLCSCTTIALRKDGKTFAPEKMMNSHWKFEKEPGSYINENVVIISNHNGLIRIWETRSPIGRHFKDPDECFGLSDIDFIVFVIDNLKRRGLWSKTINIRWLPRVLLGNRTLIGEAVIYLPKEE